MLSNESLIYGDINSYLRQADSGQWQINRQIDPQWGNGEEWTVIPAEVARICQAVTSNNISLGQLLRYLCESYTKLSGAQEAVERMRSLGNETVKIIADRFWREAEDRNWCQEADQIVDDINNQIANIGADWELWTREREYAVHVEERYEIVVNRVITVSARNADDASDLASEAEPLDDDEIAELVRYQINPTLENRDIDDVVEQ